MKLPRLVVISGLHRLPTPDRGAWPVRKPRWRGRALPLRPTEDDAAGERFGTGDELPAQRHQALSAAVRAAPGSQGGFRKHLRRLASLSRAADSRGTSASQRGVPRRGAAGLSRALPVPMTIRWLLAAVHLLALGVGLGAVWARGRALRGELDAAGLRRAFYADTWWGIAAVLWIGTGLARAFGGFEKGSLYYLHSHFFWAKISLLAVILLLDLRPMSALMQCRRLVPRGDIPYARAAARFARISFIQAALVVLMVLAATAMARGYGVPAR